MHPCLGQKARYGDSFLFSCEKLVNFYQTEDLGFPEDRFIQNALEILISFMRATGSSLLILLSSITLKIFCRRSKVALLSTTQHSLPAMTSINSLTHLLEKHQARIQPDTWCHIDWKFMSLQKNLPDNYNVILSVTRLELSPKFCQRYCSYVTYLITHFI